MSTTNRLSAATTNAAEALARIDSTLDQLYAAASIVIETVADYDALDEAPLHHRAAALTAIDRFIDRLEKRRAAEAPKPEPEIEEENEKETWQNAYLMFTYGKYEKPLARHDPDDEVYMHLLRRSEALREADEAGMAADAAAARAAPKASSASATSRTPHVNAAPSGTATPPRVSPDHVRAQITPYTDPAPATKSYSPLSSLGWSDDSYEHADDPLFAQ
jgi:hypothetical protein